MLKKYTVFFFLIYMSYVAFSQDSFSVFLIGDAGNLVTSNKILESLKIKLEEKPNSIVFFMGDNIYPKGLDGSKEAYQKLNLQLNSLKNYQGEWIFLPGNHDWNNGLWKGYECIIRQQKYVNQYALDSIKKAYKFEHFYPKDGMPGPVHFEIGSLSFIISDTDWWLHRQFFHKVGKTASYKTMEKKYLLHLDSLLSVAKSKNQTPIFLSHHPLVNYGKHAQSRQPWMFLVNYTPFQIFGLLGVNRALMSESRQPRYSRMAKKILQILDKYNPYICVAGHEHNLQHIVKNNSAYLISGAGSKLTQIPEKSLQFHPLRKGISAGGFMELKTAGASKIALTIFDANGSSIYEVNDVYK